MLPPALLIGYCAKKVEKRPAHIYYVVEVWRKRRARLEQLPLAGRPGSR